MDNLSKFRSWFKQHFWGIALLIFLLIASNIVVKIWKARHPGAMNVIEAQAMDMTAMKPPTGAVPVATEVVGASGFTAKVKYTGSVAPYTEQNIYPRVEGWLQNLNVYNGDRVPAGKLLAVIDSPDLQTKVAEAAAGSAAAATEIGVAQASSIKMAAERAASIGEIETAKSEVAGAKARLTASRRGVTKAQNELKTANANLDYWQAEIRREENLLKAGAVSVQEYQSEKAQAITAQAEVDNKQAALEEARANVEAAQAEVSSRQAMTSVARKRAAAADAGVSMSYREINQKSAMARQADAMVSTAATIDSYRYLRAPFAGVVTKRYISPGQLVNPGTAVLNIVQIDKVRLQANVADKDVSRIQIGAEVIARLPKEPNKSYHARVTSISPQQDQSSRTAIVEAIIDNPGHKLVPGDYVSMEIATSASVDSITVPSSAIVHKDDRNAVWVVKSEAPKGKMTYYCTMHPEVTSDKPGTCPKCNMKLEPKTSGGNKKAHLVYVVLGENDGERTEVISGLSDGDEVIYQGHIYLKEGDIVFSTSWSKDGPKEMPKAPGMGEMPGMNHKGDGKSPSMDNENMPGMDHEGMENMPGMDHSQMNMKEQPESSSGTKSKPLSIGKSSKAQKTYICPMHPEVMSHKAGETCPKCGMDLVEKK
ncbi:MAG: efflux RND transporter periplasmic adaptor subunit [Armatimonadota bacterium]|nr:efflux RND transporter periplasmic adaptor subunit [Armatimonadota bacterium]